MTLNPVTPAFLEALTAIVGPDAVASDAATLDAFSMDALKRDGHPPDVVVRPSSTAEVAAVARLCDDGRVALVPRGAGTGYTGGAVPVRGGVLMSMERMNRILDIDVPNMLAVVQPQVINAELQAAAERAGLFYPPDPASLGQSTLGGNVAENAGGPRAFKDGTTKRYVLGVEAVLPSGEVLRIGSRTVKNVVGYDLTSLLVGSEGTLAILTELTLRLVPRPAAAATFRAAFPAVRAAAEAVSAIIARGIEPATLELMDSTSIQAAETHMGESLAPPGTEALLLIEIDGAPSSLNEQARQIEQACLEVGATGFERAADEATRDRLWRVRREVSIALRTLAPMKYNHDVVVPKGRVPALFDAVEELRRRYGLRIPCFGHAGDGNIHVNILVDPANPGEVERAHEAERALFEAVIALEGSISGEHGIGFAKIPYIGMQLSAGEIALMRRIKAAFDPNGILNPGKIFPEEG